MIRHITFAICLISASVSTAQFEGRRSLFNDQTPMGVIGRSRSDLRGPLHCRYQPVKISAHATSSVSIAQSGTFSQETPESLHAGLRVGAVYRLRVTNIPFFEGHEVYPTVELIDRIYPPNGQEVRFAIPIVITEDDLEQAINGNLVTRVVYLEDPQTALPIADQPGTQREMIISAGEDALGVADTLGRPVAIIRFGSRTPPTNYEEMNSFLLGSPEWFPLDSPRQSAEIPAGQTAAIRTPHIPRTDIDQIPPYVQRIATPVLPPYLAPQRQNIRR